MVRDWTNLTPKISIYSSFWIKRFRLIEQKISYNYLSFSESLMIQMEIYLGIIQSYNFTFLKNVFCRFWGLKTALILFVCLDRRNKTQRKLLKTHVLSVGWRGRYVNDLYWHPLLDPFNIHLLPDPSDLIDIHDHIHLTLLTSLTWPIRPFCDLIHLTSLKSLTWLIWPHWHLWPYSIDLTFLTSLTSLTWII